MVALRQVAFQREAALRVFGLVLALGLAQTSHGHANGSDPADAPTNISVNFETGVVTFTSGHCQDSDYFDYRFATNGLWTSTLVSGGTATIAAIADEANSYVETRMWSSDDSPHCTGGNSITSTIAYTRTTISVLNRTPLLATNLDYAQVRVRFGSLDSTLTATQAPPSHSTVGSSVSLSTSGTTGLDIRQSGRSSTSITLVLRLRSWGTVAPGASFRIVYRQSSTVTYTSPPFLIYNDYDSDNDGLIEIRSLAQLNAMRWDVDGDGAVADGDQTNYSTAFVNSVDNMGCPTNTDDMDDNDCIGYELMADLDFDTDDDGATWTEPSGTFTADPDDDYYNGGSGWDPIGPASTPSDTTHFNAVFDGNGHVIENLLVNRGSANYNGLFAALRASAVVRSLGLVNARVRGLSWAGALAGRAEGSSVAGAWSTGTVQGRASVGGLIGRMDGANAQIVASYSTAAVECASLGNYAGGLVGVIVGATIAASYSTGTVTGGCGARRAFVYVTGNGTVTTSYWDTDLSNIADDGDANPPEGKRVAELREPTGYTGLYAAWDDVDVDDDGTAGVAMDPDDDAWDFGEDYQHPVLKFGGFDTARQFALQPYGFVFDADPSTATMDEAGPLALAELRSASNNSASYTVRLRAQPPQDVTVTITGSDPDAVTLEDLDGNSANGVQNTLTFTMASWDTAQTVTLTAQQDDDAGDETVAISHVASTATSSQYSDVSAAFTATVADDETRGITLAPTMLAVPESLSSTYTVKLDSAPIEERVTVAITGAADGISTRPTQLAFTARNWRTAQIVTVSAADDPNAIHETVTLTHAATGADYDGVTSDIGVTATDDEAPSLRVNPTNLTVREGANTTYSMRLNAMPSAAVTVTVGGTSAAVAVDADRQTTGNQTTLTFDGTNWNVDQTVIVNGLEDDDATVATTTLTHAATGATEYTGLTVAARPSVYVTVVDNDQPAILIDADPTTAAIDESGPLALNEMSGHADNAKNYTVRLATEPNASVTVMVSSGDRAVAVDTDTTPRTLSLTFTTMNWATRQTVTAMAAEDDDASNEEVTISHSAIGGDYQGVTAQLSATTEDDDEPAIVVDATTLTGSGVAEGGTATYTVRLGTEPASVVQVSVSTTGSVVVDMDGEQADRQSSLRFDATNWNTERTVIVHGTQDHDAAVGTATLAHTATGADYGDAPPVEITFSVTDDDTPTVLADRTSLTLNEGSTATYSVTLATEPVGVVDEVEVTVTSSDTTAATVAPAVLTFAHGLWNVPQLVTVAGVIDDGDTTDGSANITHAASGADYGSATVPTVAVTVRDDDAAGVRIEPPQLRIREGDTGSYGIRLNTQPAGNVGVTPIAGVGGTELAVSGAGTALTFTPDDWAQERTVTVEILHDLHVDDEDKTVLHLVAGYAGVTSAPALAIEVEDDDVPTLAFAPTSWPTLTEGRSTTETYTVALTGWPSANVTVSLSSNDAGLALDTNSGSPGDQTTLTFTTGDWDMGQTVTVRAVADADAANEVVTLLHTAAGGGYDGVVGYHYVQLRDADAAPAPTGVAVSSAGPTSLRVVWRSSPTAQGHWVRWVREDEFGLEEFRRLDVPAGMSSARIEGLETGVTYLVRVVALNRGDPGGRSSLFRATPRADSTSTGGSGAPQAANVPGAVVLEAGGEASIDLSNAFTDPDGDALTYAAFTSNDDVVSARIDGGALLLGAGRSGSAEVTLTATDSGGLSASTTITVDVIGTSCTTELAQAPEGGTATAMAELTAPAKTPTTVRWRIVADADPATADADAGDHGDASGEVVVAVGERCAEIDIEILDDADAEPAREWFAVELQLRFAGSASLATRLVPVAVREGVCDRTPAVARALLTATGLEGCDAPAATNLASVQTLRLAGAGLRALAASDLGGLAGLRTLDLSENGLNDLRSLSSLPRLERLLLSGNALAEVPRNLPSPERLLDLNLSANALSELPSDAFDGLSALRVLRLDGNELEALPDGVFEGLSSLRLLRLDDNPGTPFALPVNVERTDADPWAPSPARLRVATPLGAPFDMTVGLSAEGGVFADGTTTAETVVSAGELASPRLSLSSATGFAQVSPTPPSLPSRLCLGQPCWRGFEFAMGEPLALFVRPLEVLSAPEPEPLFGDALRLPLTSLVVAGDATASGELTWRASSSDESVAEVRIVNGELVVEAIAGAEGVALVEATATDALGQTATVYFEVQVDFHWRAGPTRGWRGAIPLD